jgi:two-component system, sensor histidine kinase and response regulator
MRPTCASSAAEALRRLHEAQREGDPYRLVLADVQMPVTDGFALVEQIQQHEELGSTVIMMLTSSDQPGDVGRCERLGIAAYVRKPVKQSELFDAVVMAIGASELDRAEPAPPAAAAIGRPLLVLLAEDSLVNQKVASALLEREGHRVVVANNGKEAVDAATSQEFDAVLMDVQMPEMDGFEATEAIRLREKRSGRRVPIIAMTAHALKGDRQRCLEADMDDYVSKPIRAEELFEALAAAAAGRKPVEVPPAAPPQPDGGLGPGSEEPEVPSGGSEHAETAPAAGPPGPAPAATVPSGEPVNWEAALAGVRGDRELLGDIARAALEESPRLLEDIERAIARGDATALRLSAHTLKGSIRYFEAQQPFDYAYQLEMMGKNDDLEDAGPVLEELKQEMAQLSGALRKYLEEEDASAAGQARGFPSGRHDLGGSHA